MSVSFAESLVDWESFARLSPCAHKVHTSTITSKLCPICETAIRSITFSDPEDLSIRRSTSVISASDIRGFSESSGEQPFPSEGMGSFIPGRLQSKNLLAYMIFLVFCVSGLFFLSVT